MRIPRRVGNRPSIWLAQFAAVVSCFTWTGAAAAQEDPFALPAGVTAETASRAGTPGRTEIIVDGERKVRMVDLAWLPDGSLGIEAADAETAGLPVPAGSRGKIAIGSLKLVKWDFDGLRQSLSVRRFRNSDGANLIDLSPIGRSDGESGALTWGRADYDIIASRTPGTNALAGAFNLSAGRGNFFVGTTFTAQIGEARGVFRRLDSQVQLLIPRKGLVLTAGDFITAVTENQRAVRLGGVQISTDFSLRPDLITTPLPSYTAQVAVPTAVDLLVNGQRTTVGELQPGAFTIRNLPMANGRGNVAVIVRDVLGREVVQNVGFYASPSLLAPGLRQFSANLGFVRRRYGERDNEYGQPVFSGFYRRGLTRGATAEVSVEASRGLLNGGARLDMLLAKFALVTVEGRFSRSSALGSGSMVAVALESSGQKVSARIRAVLPSKTYRDVAATLGDQPLQRSLIGQISFDLGEMRLQVSAGRVWRAADRIRAALAERDDFASAMFRLPLSRRASLNTLVAYRNSGPRPSFEASVGVSMRFGRRGFADAATTWRNDRKMAFGASYRQPDSLENPLGYSIEANHGDRQLLRGGLIYRPQYGSFELTAQRDGTALSVRGNARGSVILAGGGLFARTQTGSSYALVKAGKIGGVTVLRENRVAGKTARNGLLLIEDVVPHVPVSFDVDPDLLPADVLTKRTARRLVIPRRAVGLVAMEVFNFRPQQFLLHTVDGIPVEPGTNLVARPSGDTVIVGFEGMAEINAAAGDRYLEMPLSLTTNCRITLPAPGQFLPSGAPLRCTAIENVPVQISGKGSPRAIRSAARRR